MKKPLSVATVLITLNQLTSMKKILIGSILASLAMFVWGWIYWMNPLAYQVVKIAKDDAAAQEALQAQFPDPGVYFIPGNYDNMETFRNLHQQGPVALVQISGGKTPMDPKMMVFGWLHMFLVALFIAMLMMKSGMAEDKYWCKVVFSGLLGLLSGFFIHVGAMIWMYQPLTYSLFNILYATTLALVAGLVLAKFVKAE